MKFQNNIEELLISPVSEHCIAIGYMLGGVARGLCTALIVTTLSLLFTDLHIHNLFLTILVVVLTACVFSLGGLINAIYAKSFDDISIIPTFVLQPLTYLGGVFYSISLLPPFWQKVSLLNPVFHMVNAFRYGILGVTDINIWIAIIALVITCVIAYYIAWSLLKKGTGIRN